MTQAAAKAAFRSGAFYGVFEEEYPIHIHQNLRRAIKQRLPINFDTHLIQMPFITRLSFSFLNDITKMI